MGMLLCRVEGNVVATRKHPSLEGWKLTICQPIARDGKGWAAVVDLPYGSKASDAVKRREDIAAGLDIDEVQVFLSRHRGRDGSARRVTLWVADEDPYAERPPVSPLAALESLDFWRGFPFGLDARDPKFWQGGLGVIERMIGELERLDRR